MIYKNIILLYIIMGNLIVTKKNLTENNIINDEYENFLLNHCNLNAHKFCSYYQFCYVFALYLKNKADDDESLMLTIKELTKKKTINTNDWNTISMIIIDELCNKNRLTRVGSPNKQPMILGITIKQLPDY